MNYKDLEVWKLAGEVVAKIHVMTINELPGFEKFETGNQIRRSSKSVKSNIVEGFGRRKSKKEFLQFLRIAIASNDETLDHLETLFMTGSLKNEEVFKEVKENVEVLGKKLNRFIKAVEKNHRV